MVRKFMFAAALAVLFIGGISAGAGGSPTSISRSPCWAKKRSCPPTTTTTPTPTTTTTTTTTPSGAAQTGTYWADTSDYATLGLIGMGYAVKNVAPGDVAGAKAALDAAHAASIKLIIGLYSFGGPEPYTINADGTWNFTAGAVQVIQYLASRPNDVLAFFGMNEPYWEDQAGRNTKMDGCGVFSAAELRQFRAQVQQIGPGLKVYQDIGWPSEWSSKSVGDPDSVWKSCVGTKYDDQSGVADYVGIWAYPVESGGYDANKSLSIARFNRESNFVINNIHATPVWLGQSFDDGAGYPTDAQIKDWNCSMRAIMPAGALLSWYVWANQYPDFLKNHPSQWPLVEASAC
jgi:hypothetical protein